MTAREELIDLAEDAKICDCCGKPLADLGLTDAVEQIEIETIVYRRVIRRKRYRQNLRLPGSIPNRHRAAAEGPAQEHLRHELVGASAPGKVSLAAANASCPHASCYRAAPAVGTKPRAGNDRRRTQANRASADADLRQTSRAMPQSACQFEGAPRRSAAKTTMAAAPNGRVGWRS